MIVDHVLSRQLKASATHQLVVFGAPVAVVAVEDLRGSEVLQRALQGGGPVDFKRQVQIVLVGAAGVVDAATHNLHVAGAVTKAIDVRQLVTFSHAKLDGDSEWKHAARTGHEACC